MRDSETMRLYSMVFRAADWLETPALKCMAQRRDVAREIRQNANHAIERLAGQRGLDTLAHNLAIAGALCRAYRIGYIIGGANPLERDWWRPGCGKPAPKTRAG